MAKTMKKMIVCDGKIRNNPLFAFKPVYFTFQ